MCFIIHGYCVNLDYTQKCVNFLHKFTNSYVYFVYNTVYPSKNNNMCCRINFLHKVCLNKILHSKISKYTICNHYFLNLEDKQ
jgi:hypothetical protein